MQWSNNATRYNAISPISLLFVFLISTDISIFLNIPFFRQVLGFITLAFIPGMLFLCILKPSSLRLTEMFVLSVGLSISYTMFIGILINTLYPLFGYETPLSVISLVISFSAALLMLAFAAHLRGGFALFAKRTYPKLNTRDKALVVIPILFLPLSVLGMHIMNATNNNAMLMALLFLIPGYVILISLIHNQIPKNSYPVIIFLSSISLVILLGMRSSHIVGVDAHREFFLFQQTLFFEKWQILEASTLDSCLSISILPGVFQSFLSIDSEYLFKILYPLIFSVSPLVIYIIAREYLHDIYAFLASVFFMSQNVFLSTAANPRTTVAILFFALSIMVLLNDRLSEFEKKLMLIIFIFSCIVSHYSTTYIFFGILLFGFISVKIISRQSLYQKRSPAKNDPPVDEYNVMDSTSRPAGPELSKSNLTLGLLIIFFAVLFVWYSQVTGTAFESGVGFLFNSMRSLQDFFIIESREEGVAMAFGYRAGEFEVHQKIIFIFSWLTIILIAFGVLTTLSRHRQRVALFHKNIDNNYGLLKKRMSILYLSLAIICSAVMVASVIFPFASKGYGISRAYLLATVVLSSFFVLGGMTVAELISIRWKYIVVLTVLIPFFMCATGTIGQVFGYPGSMVLNSEGDSFDIMYIHDQESISAKWLKKYADLEKNIYADYWSGGARLISQGGIRHSLKISPKEFKQRRPLGNAYIYLNHNNVVDGKIFLEYSEWISITEFMDEFAKKELVYSNGASMILISKH